MKKQRKGKEEGKRGREKRRKEKKKQRFEENVIAEYECEQYDQLH